jgi:hypothetical protein
MSGSKSNLDVFEDQLEGFVFEQAAVLIKQNLASARHASHALIALVTPYFEMITCYIEGREPGARESTEFLRRGLVTVLASTATPEAVSAYVKEVRNGIAHELMFRTVILHRGVPHLPGFGIVDGILTVDAFWLFDEVQTHFRAYVARLRSPANEADHLALANFNRFMNVRKAREPSPM